VILAPDRRPEDLYESVTQESQKSPVVAGDLGEHKCEDRIDDLPALLQAKEIREDIDTRNVYEHHCDELALALLSVLQDETLLDG